MIVRCSYRFRRYIGSLPYSGEKPLEANAKIHVSYKKLLEVLLGMRWSVERFMIKLEIKLLP